jgi:hypothetical protein
LETVLWMCSRAAVVPDPGVPGVLLQIIEAGVVAGPDRVLHRLPVLPPRPGGLLITGGAGFDLLGFEGGVQDGHRFLNTERHVQERDVLAFILGRVQSKLYAAFSVGVRLGVQ